VGDLKSLEAAGTGITIEGAAGGDLRNVKARGFATGLVIRHAQAVVVEGCDFSDNYDKSEARLGRTAGTRRRASATRPALRGAPQPRQPGMGRHSSHRGGRQHHLRQRFFPHCSNTCAKLWRASRNRFLNNNLSYGIRIDARGRSPRARLDLRADRDRLGRTITGIATTSPTAAMASSYGRSTAGCRAGNVFVENDTSYAIQQLRGVLEPGQYVHPQQSQSRQLRILAGRSTTRPCSIGNEAAFNGPHQRLPQCARSGLPPRRHRDRRRPSSHTLIEGNHLHDNNGAGLAFRGDVESQGRKWRTEHWIVQQNRIENNRFGLWGRFGNAIVLGANVFSSNVQGNYLTTRV